MAPIRAQYPEPVGQGAGAARVMVDPDHFGTALGKKGSGLGVQYAVKGFQAAVAGSAGADFNPDCCGIEQFLVKGGTGGYDNRPFTLTIGGQCLAVKPADTGLFKKAEINRIVHVAVGILIAPAHGEGFLMDQATLGCVLGHDDSSSMDGIDSRAGTDDFNPLTHSKDGLMRYKILFALLAFGLTAGAMAQASDNEAGKGLPGDVDPRTVAQSSVYDGKDPWEPFNRSIFTFNEVLDGNVIRPVARGYNRVTPEPVNEGVTNFFSNIAEPGNILNSLLQGKGEAALISTGRFIFNTTFGLLGLVDVASHMELPEQDEDIGQTFGYWGMETGPFLMLPVLGPSTVRDTAGMGIEYGVPDLMDPIETRRRYGLYALYGLDTRASLLRYEERITGDRYTFIRNTYLQRREYKINDGQVKKDPFAQDDEDLMLEDF